jgi:hypothetical protein
MTEHSLAKKAYHGGYNPVYRFSISLNFIFDE